MRFTTTKAVIAAVGLALSLAACGDGGTSDHVETDVADNPSFDAGTTPAKLADAGKIKIGVKFDQPGIGYKVPGSDTPEGFDIEMGRLVAAGLGIDDDSIKWVETVSANRETFLQKGTVDVVLASYSITPDRQKVVGQAGPYYVTGQQLLVRKDNTDITGPDDLKGAKVCSVEGSTSLARVQDEYGAKPVPFGTYSECVDQLLNKTVDAVTTDGAILLGYAADHPDDLKVVGDAFSEERYGIGYKKDDAEMCNYLNDTMKKAFDDGTWEDAFDATLGGSDGVETPDQPELDPCK